MSKQGKSWREKLHDSKDLPKVVKISGKMRKRWGNGTLVIPAPLEVNDLMRKVPRGKLITINEIREYMARKHKVSIGCPLTCGIFAWVAAHAAHEDWQAGKKRITPYWRTLKTGGVINEKYPGGVEVQKKLLQQEGHKIVRKGKKHIVVDFEKRLMRI